MVLMKKIFCTALLVFVMALSAFPAYAAKVPGGSRTEHSFHLDYVNIASLNAGLSIDSAGKADCRGDAALYQRSNTSVLSVTLQKYSGGRWTAVKTWSQSGRGTIPTHVSKSYHVVRGKYRVAAAIKVYRASGTLLETQTDYSSEVTY